MSDMDRDFKVSKVIRDATQGVQQSHEHPYYEIFYLVNGDCTFFMNHNIYKLKQGDMVIVPKGVIHKSTYPEKGSSERYVICFRDTNFQWLSDMIDKELIVHALDEAVISIPQRRRSYVESIIEKLLTESDDEDDLSPAFISIGIVQLILFIIRCQNFEENIIKEIDSDNKLIQEVATYVYKNYEKTITLEQVSDMFHISKSYLSKKFKNVTGIGFKEYLVNIRIKNACKLLLETNKSITDIALECGFNDSNYFGDAFKKIKGVSPIKYRKLQDDI